jgi:hypothetical protein
MRLIATVLVLVLSFSGYVFGQVGGDPVHDCYVYDGDNSCATPQDPPLLPWEDHDTLCSDNIQCAGLIPPYTCDVGQGTVYEKEFASEAEWFQVRKKARAALEGFDLVLPHQNAFYCLFVHHCQPTCKLRITNGMWYCQTKWESGYFWTVDDFILNTSKPCPDL